MDSKQVLDGIPSILRTSPKWSTLDHHNIDRKLQKLTMPVWQVE